MPLSKSKGNMYDWCRYTHTHLGGACSHECTYCYVSSMAKHYPVMKERYTGKLRIIDKELDVKYGSGKSIFIEHCNDLFAKDVPLEMIIAILNHCQLYPDNTYVFQTKNPARYKEKMLNGYWPKNRILGCTIESDHYCPEISKAPHPRARCLAMCDLGCETFITVEPILAFTPIKLAALLTTPNPNFINIGADSKWHGLPEPTKDTILELLEILKAHPSNIEIRRKVNLERLLK